MLARPHRITSGDDYRHIVRRGARFSVPGMTVSVNAREAQDAPTRFGFIISKRVGVAVVRNRLRRRLKHISLELLTEMPTGFDIVYRLHAEVASWSFDTLREKARLCVAGAVKKRSGQGGRSSARTASVSR